MMFDKFCIDKILKGEKCVTRRLVKSNRRPGIPGQLHILKKDRTDKSYGKILINSCTREPLTNITNEDAVREGFKDKFEYFNYFKKVNKINTLNVEVWRVRFTYMGDI